MQILALDRSDRTDVLMLATAVSLYGDATPPCERAANDTSVGDPPPRPAASAQLPPRWETLRLAA